MQCNMHYHSVPYTIDNVDEDESLKFEISSNINSLFLKYSALLWRVTHHGEYKTPHVTFTFSKSFITARTIILLIPKLCCKIQTVLIIYF